MPDGFLPCRVLTHQGDRKIDLREPLTFFRYVHLQLPLHNLAHWGKNLPPLGCHSTLSVE